jgi:hypothetical protein
MPINERGEFVRDRSVESPGTVSPGMPRQIPHAERSGGGKAIIVLLILGVVAFLVWRSVSNTQGPASPPVYTPPSASLPVQSSPPVAASAPSEPAHEEGVLPTRGIPVLGATLKSVQFFESGPGQVPKEGRRYTRKFGSRGTRYINWELNFVCPTHASNINVVIETVWHKQDGSIHARQSTNSEVHPEWSDFWVTAGWGNGTGTSFAPGTYQLEFFVEGTLIDREEVEVYEGESAPAMYVQAIDARVAQPLRFFPSESEVPPKDRRTYPSQFSRARVWYINWELNLVFPAKSDRVSFTIHEVWTKPDGSIDHESDFAAYVERGWSNSHHSAGWGRVGGGGWPGLGTYRVDLFMENRKIASGNFEVVE